LPIVAVKTGEGEGRGALRELAAGRKGAGDLAGFEIGI